MTDELLARVIKFVDEVRLHVLVDTCEQDPAMIDRHELCVAMGENWMKELLAIDESELPLVMIKKLFAVHVLFMTNLDRVVQVPIQYWETIFPYKQPKVE